MPERTEFVVMSTAKNCPWARHCIYSVASQWYPANLFTHCYIAADRDTYKVALDAEARAKSKTTVVVFSDKTVVENVQRFWQALPPECVIVWLDGDDWLLHDQVLAKLAYVYESYEPKPWLTYGQFECTDRTRWPNLGTRYGAVPPREDHWRASHLKTFRAGLVQQVKEADLRRPDGSWTEYCTDQVFMLPMLEMAGEHCAVIEEPLMQYNVGASMMRKEPAKLRDEADELQRIRALRPYQLLTRRPF